MTYAETKKLLLSYKSMLDELNELQTKALDMAQKCDDIPSCTSKYGGRMPSGESPSGPERFALRNETLCKEYDDACARIEVLQEIIDRIDVAMYTYLTRRQKEICTLKFVRGMSYPKMSEELFLDEKSVFTCVARATARLSEVL